MSKLSPLLALFADRDAAATFSPDDWSLLFAEARACGLVSRLPQLVGQPSPPASMPSRFLDHLDAAEKYGQAIMRDARREVGYLRKALADIETPVVLLKGAAYVIAGLPPARGRVFSDIDILVERSRIASAEGALMLAGWAADKKDAYDQRYYREWSHEIPPLTHLRRGTTVDLHHSLVMPSCRIRVDSAQMVADAVPLDGLPGWRRLRDEDLVLHAAAHLMLNSEFDRGLRDLGDIDLLLRHFSDSDGAFASRVMARAVSVGLGSIAARTFALCVRFYRTPISPELLADRRDPMVILLAAAATTRHPDARPLWQPLADLVLAGREVSLRLPPLLLLRHLSHKAWLGLTARRAEA